MQLIANSYTVNAADCQRKYVAAIASLEALALPPNRCEATASADVHDWWPVQVRCSKPPHERGAHIEESPNSVAGPHCVIWRDGEKPQVFWYPQKGNCEHGVSIGRDCDECEPILR